MMSQVEKWNTFEARDVINDDLIEYNWLKIIISHDGMCSKRITFFFRSA